MAGVIAISFTANVCLLQAYRWDGETGGIALVAKTKLAFQQLSGAFEAREVGKRFVALVGGRLQGRGMVDIPLDGMPCASEWRALQSVQSCRHGWITTVALQPLTGGAHGVPTCAAADGCWLLAGQPVMHMACCKQALGSHHLASRPAFLTTRLAGALQCRPTLIQSCSEACLCAFMAYDSH